MIPPLLHLLRRALAPFLLLAALAHAAPPPIPLHHTAWTARDGVPPFILAFAQTEDGWLWLASSVGLYRFDGVRFERYTPPNGALPSINVTTLHAAPRNGLWTGHRFGHISLLRDGRLVRSYGAAEGLPGVTIWHVLEDPQGTVWAATGLGLYRLVGERWQLLPDAWGIPAVNTLGVTVDRQGALWAQTIEGTFRLPRGAQRFEKMPGVAARGHPQLAPDGSVWIADPDRGQLVMLKAPEGQQALQKLPVAPHTYMTSFSRDGSFWLLMREGIGRMHPGPHGMETEVTGRSQGLSGAAIITSMQDREGNMWVSTTGGIDRFRPNKLTQATLPPFLGEARAIAPAPDGGLYIDHYLLPAQAAAPTGLRPGPTQAEDRNVSALYRDPSGVLWGGGMFEMWRMQDGKRSEVPRPEGSDSMAVFSMVRDNSGALWAAFRKIGVRRLVEGRWEIPQELGPLFGTVVSVHQDAEGRMWFGHSDSRVSLLDHGKVRTWGAAEGLQLGAVRQIVVNGPRVYVGGAGGLAAIADGRVLPLHGAGGEDFVGTTGMLLLPDGQLWLNSGMGIFAIPAQELGQALADKSHRLNFERFDHQDGLRGGAPQVSAVPSAVRGDDGRLWFTTTEGVFWIDPARIVRNPLPPPVVIRQIEVNGKAWTPQPDLVLPERSEQLRIDYTALSLAIPDRVQFRYRLLGVEDEWQQPGERRTAFYTRLPPGHYRFQVTAANNDGLWNERGAELAFRVQPTLTQSLWFRVLAAGAAVLALYLLYRLRMRRLATRIRHRLEERLAERERIARELHDTLLQSVHGLILRFQAVAMRMPQQEPARALMEAALQRADAVLVEGRDRVRDLRSASAGPHALLESLEAVGQSLAPDGTPAVHVTAAGEARALHPLVAEEVFAIAREAMVNAVRHARASTVDVAVTYEDAGFRLQVRDDGRGIERAVLEAGGRSGHWGLPGMQERADKIHARLQLRTREGGGTEWLLALPAALAYLPGPRRAGWRFWQGGDDTEQAA